MENLTEHLVPLIATNAISNFSYDDESEEVTLFFETGQSLTIWVMGDGFLGVKHDQVPQSQALVEKVYVVQEA